jgi:valacyclovir hydrolase
VPYADLATGATLHYVDEGSGPPVLLIHGMMGTAETHFPRLIDWLSRDYHVIAPTLRGYGQSTPKPRQFPLDFYRRDAEDMLALIEMLGLAPLRSLGYSDGGEVALLAAGLAPERFRSLITWGASGYLSPAIRPAVQAFYPVDWFTEADRALHSLDNPVPVVMQWIRSMKMLIDLGGDISLSLAEKISCPVLMLLGDRDTLNPAAAARVMAERLPEGRLEVLRCGHAVHDEQWEAFQGIVGDFLHDVEVREGRT